MALSQMGVPDYTSGSDSVYLCSVNSGITEINATGRYHSTETSYCPVKPRLSSLCRTSECQKRTLGPLI